MIYSYKRLLDIPFAEAEKKVREELLKEGFGIITEINVKETFKKKLDVEFESYVILGACHPSSAHKILEADKELGLLLPCNVLVYEKNKKVNVSAIMPASLIKVLGGEEIAKVANDIEMKLKKVVDSV